MQNPLIKLSPITNTKTVFSYIESFTNLEKGKFTYKDRNYRLDRMFFLLEQFDNPHKAFKSIHVAGTKGKGSTAVLLASVLSSAGFKTGLYTSPHISNYTERINVSLKPVKESILVKLTNYIREKIQRLNNADNLPGNFTPTTNTTSQPTTFAPAPSAPAPSAPAPSAPAPSAPAPSAPTTSWPTTFELLTLLCFLCFKEMGCEFGVIETGIGGRLDATNVITPIASVITPIDLEHTNILGQTLKEISAEKGGIIKPGIPVFVGFQKETEIKHVLNRLSIEKNSPIFFLDDELENLKVNSLDINGTSFSLKLNKTMQDFRLALIGDFQAENASLAYLVLTHLFPELPMHAYKKGFLNATLPGRMEIIQKHAPIVLDGAHTPMSVQRMLCSYRKLFPQKGILIFGSVIDKKPEQMAKILFPWFNEIIISTPGSFKQSSPEHLFHIFKTLHNKVRLIKDPSNALNYALKTALNYSLNYAHNHCYNNKLPILVTGSFYMVSEIRRCIF